MRAPAAVVLTLTLLTAACHGEPPGAPEPEAEPTGAGVVRIPPAMAGTPLFALVGDDAVTDSVERWRLAATRGERSSRSVRVARLLEDPDAIFTSERAVAFDVAPGRRLVFLGAPLARTSGALPGWKGDLTGIWGQALLVWSDVGITASLHVWQSGAAAAYAVRPLGSSGPHLIIEIDQSVYAVD